MELMDGVILLEECTGTTETGDMIFWCSLIVVVLMTIALVALCFKSREVDKPIKRVDKPIKRIVSILIIISACASITGIFVPSLPAFQEKTGRLEVIITQDADMDELLEQYTIIDHENGKYIIEEKE